MMTLARVEEIEIIRISHSTIMYIVALAVLGIVSAALLLRFARHMRSDWKPGRIRAMFAKMDSLDAVESPDAEYAEVLAELANGLPSWAAAGAVDRIGDPNCPSRRRCLEILRASDLTDWRDHLGAIALDAKDPLAPEVWSLLTGLPAGGWGKALASMGKVDFATPIRPPSGEWCGYYGQFGAEHRMRLNLYFEDSAISGEGTDVVGRFTIDGRMDGVELSLQKHYGMHSVEYRGYLEGDQITGTWHLTIGTGDFRLWPMRGVGGQ